MANYTSVNGSAHKTLTANSVDVVTLPTGYELVEVINRDAASDLYVTVDTGYGGSLTPTVAGDGCLYVGPGGVRNIDVRRGTNPQIVRLISAGAVAYSVTGIGSGDIVVTSA